MLHTQESLDAVSAKTWIFRDCFCDLTLTCSTYISGMLAGFCVQLLSQFVLSK